MGVLGYVGTLLLGGVVGWAIGQLLSLPGRAARDRKQAELIKAASKEGAKEGVREYEDWQRKHPGEPITDPIREQIAVASTTVAVETLTGVASLQDPKLWVSMPASMTTLDDKKGGAKSDKGSGRGG
jgi:hypothetical protein